MPIPQPRDGLASLRLVLLTFVSSDVLFGYVLFVITMNGTQGDPGLWPWLAAGVGLAALICVQWALHRKLEVSSPAACAASYRTNWFMGVAFANIAALFGFVGAFVTQLLWIYGIGLAFALVGFAMVAPTDAAIQRKDDQLAAMGVPYSLRDALRGAPPRRPD